MTNVGSETATPNPTQKTKHIGNKGNVNEVKLEQASMIWEKL